MLADSYTVSGGNSPSSGFGVNSGVNYNFAARVSGVASAGLLGYRLGGTGGTSPRQASDFSIAGNRLTVAPRNGNGRFEFSPDGTSGYNLGSFLAGRNYELQVQMNISVVGTTYSQRMSMSLADVSNVAIASADLGVQIGSDGAGGLGVFKRVAAASNSGGSDLNVRLMSGLPIGTPINFKLRVVDYNADSVNFNSSYEILVNDVVVDAGWFRFNDSVTGRYAVFDVAAHEGAVHYDNFQITVTGGGSDNSVCRKPVLGLCEYTVEAPNSPQARLYWSTQPGLAVQPEFSGNLAEWLPLTNGLGAALRVTTGQGTIQWLDVNVPGVADGGAFFRLKRE